MIHQPDIGSFDPSNPDAAQALRDSVEIIAQLADARSKPTPRKPQQVLAHAAHIRNLEGLLGLKAERAGCSSSELEKLAFGELKKLRQRQGLPAPAMVVRFKPEERREPSEAERKALHELYLLRDEAEHLERLIAKHQARLAKLRGEIARRELEMGGRR